MERNRSTLAVAFLLATAPALAAEGNDAVDAVFKDYGAGTPGCALGVIRAGHVDYAKGYGLASLEFGVPIDPMHTVFDLGSTSKQFTATSILLLAHDGKLSLGDDIRKWLPEVPDYGTPITIQHLLNHTSGLRDYIDVMYLGGDEDADHTTVAEALAAVARQKQLNFTPGSEHLYSNTGYFLLSLIVERASGQSLAKFAAERIFTPLAMRDTFILDRYDRVVPHKATAYEPAEGGGYTVHLSDWEQTGDGAVQTTVADLAKWDAQFYAPTLGGPWLFEQLQERGTLSDGKRIDYARGLMHDAMNGHAIISHGGAWAGFRAELLRVPDDKLSVAVLCNRGDSDPVAMARTVAGIVLGDREAPPAAEAAAGKPPADAARWAGRYYAARRGSVRDLVVDEGKLWYVRGPGARSELVDAGNGRVRMIARGDLKELVLDAEGRTLRLESDGQVIEFAKVEPFAPTPAALQDFAGAYASTELATDTRMSVVDGALNFTTPLGETLPLQPAFADAFTGPGGLLLRFHRDAARKVDGFALDAGTTRDLRFVREP
jgi:CubicO group peptidase (beta-lactamase class C family)